MNNKTKLLIISIAVLTMLCGCNTGTTQNSEPISNISESSQQNPRLAEITAEDITYALQQAPLLTEHLILSADNINGTYYNLDKDKLNPFVILTYRFGNNPDYMYDNLIEEGGEYGYTLSKEKVDQLVYEVAGAENFILEMGDTVLNPKTQNYDTSLGFGVGTTYLIKDMQPPKLNGANNIEITYTLTSNNELFEGPLTVYGNYKITFAVMKEDNVFLRFVSIEQLP